MVLTGHGKSWNLTWVLKGHSHEKSWNLVLEKSWNVISCLPDYVLILKSILRSIQYMFYNINNSSNLVISKKKKSNNKKKGGG